jgi:hypothetical protein
MIQSSVDILVRVDIIYLEVHVIRITPHKRTIIVMEDGHFLEQRVMHTMMQPVMDITHVHQVDR